LSISLCKTCKKQENVINNYFVDLYTNTHTQPETVPQAIIDMNRVVEVSYEAEEVTGHPFSLALTAADRVHFLKGTSREESKWWFDILSMFPRTNMKVCVCHFFLILIIMIIIIIVRRWEIGRVIDRPPFSVFYY
jgi:hypothetical protein